LSFSSDKNGIEDPDDSEFSVIAALSDDPSLPEAILPLVYSLCLPYTSDLIRPWLKKSFLPRMNTDVHG
jgi:hypothetical protein